MDWSLRVSFPKLLTFAKYPQLKYFCWLLNLLDNLTSKERRWVWGLGVSLGIILVNINENNVFQNTFIFIQSSWSPWEVERTDIFAVIWWKGMQGVKIVSEISQGKKNDRKWWRWTWPCFLLPGQVFFPSHQPLPTYFPSKSFLLCFRWEVFKSHSWLFPSKYLLLKILRHLTMLGKGEVV